MNWRARFLWNSTDYRLLTPEYLNIDEGYSQIL